MKTYPRILPLSTPSSRDAGTEALTKLLVSAKAVGVLAHNQPHTALARTHVTRAVAAFWLQQMIAEQITSKVIRMFPPGSVFQRVETSSDAPADFGPADPTGTKFALPQSPQWQDEHLQATRSLAIRAGLSFAVFRRQSHKVVGVSP